MKNADRVLEYLKAGHTLTAFDGFTKLGIVSVRDYISMIRLQDGIDIKSRWEISTSKKRYKIYWIDNKPSI